MAVLLETWGWFHVYRPFDGFMPSWRYHHMRKPNSVIGPRAFFSFNPRLVKLYPETARWHYNAQGWLHPEDITSPKPPNTYRIFYLGDSFTEGQTLEEDSMPRVVGARLAELRGDSPRLEVVNAGTVSYSPTLYFLVIRNKVIDFDPDVVVINVDMTDDLDEWKCSKRTILDENGDPLASPFVEAHMAAYVDTASGTIRSSILTKALLFLYTKSYFASYLRFIGLTLSGDLDAAAKAPPAETLYSRWSWCHDEWDERTEKVVAGMFETLRRLVTYCRRHNVRVMMTAVPYCRHYHTHDDGDEPFRFSVRPHYELEKLCRELGVPYLNSYEALMPFVEEATADQFYLQDDIHFNAEGNRLWAEQQVQFLMDPSHDLLPKD